MRKSTQPWGYHANHGTHGMWGQSMWHMWSHTHVCVGSVWGQIYQMKTLYKLSQGEFESVQKDLARLTGEAVKDIQTLEANIKTGYDIIAPIMADQPSRQLIFDFLREYIDGTPEVASASFKVEITLEVILVIGTLGAGATVTAARMGQRVGQFSVHALELIVKLSRTLKQFNKRVTIEAAPPVRRVQGPSGKAGKPSGSVDNKKLSGSSIVPDKVCRHKS